MNGVSPAKPEAECAQHNQGRGVSRHVLHNAVLVKAAHARADEGGAHEAREAAGHVHHAAARKVKQAGAEQGARAERRQPSGLGPCPVSHGGVPETENATVNCVAPFCRDIRAVVVVYSQMLLSDSEFSLSSKGEGGGGRGVPKQWYIATPMQAMGTVNTVKSNRIRTF